MIWTCDTCGKAVEEDQLTSCCMSHHCDNLVCADCATD